jgi:hypothetical protein
LGILQLSFSRREFDEVFHQFTSTIDGYITGNLAHVFLTGDAASAASEELFITAL